MNALRVSIIMILLSPSLIQTRFLCLEMTAEAQKIHETCTKNTHHETYTNLTHQ